MGLTLSFPETHDRPISGTAGMDKLAPKGFKPETQIPLGRMGDGGEWSSLSC